jgi:hypothetical protein
VAFDENSHTFKLLLGRYALAIVLAFFGIRFVVTFLALAFVIFTLPRRRSETDLGVAQKTMESGRRGMSQWIN